MHAHKQAAKLLHATGMSPKYKGHAYALYMLGLAIEDPARTHNLRAQLYLPACAHFHTSAQLIERNLRFAIARNYEAAHGEGMRRLFRAYGIDYAPTNREFLCVLTHCAHHGPAPAPRQMAMW